MNNHLSIWTVFDHPKDHPDKWVARRFEVRPDGSYGPTPEYVDSFDYRMIERFMQWKGLTRLPRDPADEPQIVESWI